MNRIVWGSLGCLVVASLVGCSSKGAPTSGTGKVVDPKPDPANNDVVVELAAVTLADDCGGHLRPPPPTVKTASAAKPAASEPAARALPATPPADMAEPAQAAAPMAACAKGADCGHSYRSACEQTSMQLAFTATGTAASKVEVKKVELLDDTGKLVGELASQQPMRWSESANKYEAWDQMVAPGQAIAASYVLGSPDYNKVGGRWQAHEKRFQLRVTFAVGGKQRTVEKKAIAPTMLEPAVPT